ncbi:hypothetical protein EVAR_95645_1 [Eumeta japonica]|uniref:Uncharacterized protein n=1 Tax=Eumeta variegata TaxID=151549 RepID=A0A4C2AAE1_EUMVA|nr:hypothetical protein EVAR_95645_1 [Eumeta japonica]
MDIRNFTPWQVMTFPRQIRRQRAKLGCRGTVGLIRAKRKGGPALEDSRAGRRAGAAKANSGEWRQA